MSRKQDIETVIKAVLNMDEIFRDNYNGPYESICPFCFKIAYYRGNEPTPKMKDIKHDQSCAYLIAKDLSAKR